MEKQKPLISIITIVNKPLVYEEFKRSLAVQVDVNYELIKINNDHQQFSSARDAYNSAAKKAKGNFLLFVHPDIRFLNDRALSEVLKQLIAIPKLGIGGIAGSPFSLHGRHAYIVSTMKQGTDCQPIGTQIDRPTKVQTVDECFFLMSKKFWNQHKFSNLKGWHMYAVEECLKALEDGYVNYVVPSKVWHKSTGSSENWEYVKTGYQIVRKFGKPYQQINTTVSKWETHGWKSFVYPPIKFAKRQIERKLGING